jgi:hypothetical protein
MSECRARLPTPGPFSSGDKSGPAQDGMEDTYMGVHDTGLVTSHPLGSNELLTVGLYCQVMPENKMDHSPATMLWSDWLVDRTSLRPQLRQRYRPRSDRGAAIE